LGKLCLTASDASIFKLSYAPKAPTNKNVIPDTHPHRFRTYGRESTPDPIAEALKAKMLPLKDPASSLEKVLAQKDLSF